MDPQHEGPTRWNQAAVRRDVSADPHARSRGHGRERWPARVRDRVVDEERPESLGEPGVVRPEQRLHPRDLPAGTGQRGDALPLTGGDLPAGLAPSEPADAEAGARLLAPSTCTTGEEPDRPKDGRAPAFAGSASGGCAGHG